MDAFPYMQHPESWPTFPSKVGSVELQCNPEVTVLLIGLLGWDQDSDPITDLF
jgi:hypothetical protein